MVNKKNNVPYYIVGSLATLALLASGVFAAAPYVQVQFLAPILAPIAALGLSAPLIAVCAAFSAVVIAFSAIVVNKNRTISEKETQLADKAKVIEAKDKALAEKETQLVKKIEEIETQNQTLSEKETQLAEKDRELKDKDMVIFYMDEQLAKKNRMLRGEDDKSADSLFNDHNDDAQHKLKKARQDKFDRLVAKRKQEEASVLSDQSPIAPEYKDATNEPDAQKDKPFDNAKNEPKIRQAKSTKAVSKQKKSNRFSTKDKVLGTVSVISAIASSSVMGYLLNQVSSYISFANNSTNIGDLHNDSFSILGAGIGATGVDNLHNDGFSISEAGILAMFGFMGLAAQCFTGSIASALSFANKPINSVNDHNNPSNPGTMLDDKLNQTEKILNLSHKRAEKHFGADPKESTLKEAVIEEKVGQNGSIQTKEVVVGGSTQVGPKSLANDSINTVNDRNNSASSPANPYYTTNSSVPSGFVYNNRSTNYVIPPMQANGAVEQNISTFVYPMMKGNPCYTTDSNVLSDFVCNNRATDYTTPPNGIVERDISSWKDWFFSLFTSIARSDSTKDCTVVNVRQYDDQTFESSPCAPGDHQVPLPDLRHVAVCCPSIPKSAPPSGP